MWRHTSVIATILRQDRKQRRGNYLGASNLKSFNWQNGASNPLTPITTTPSFLHAVYQSEQMTIAGKLWKRQSRAVGCPQDHLRGRALSACDMFLSEQTQLWPSLLDKPGKSAHTIRFSYLTCSSLIGAETAERRHWWRTWRTNENARQELLGKSSWVCLSPPCHRLGIWTESTADAPATYVARV